MIDVHFLWNFPLYIHFEKSFIKVAFWKDNICGSVGKGSYIGPFCITFLITYKEIHMSVLQTCYLPAFVVDTSSSTAIKTANLVD